MYSLGRHGFNSSACELCGSGLNEFIKQGMVQNIKKQFMFKMKHPWLAINTLYLLMGHRSGL